MPQPLQPFETLSVRMEAMLRVTVQAPDGDIDRILTAVQAITPLSVGAYDCNAFRTAPGIESYRPRPGAAAGAEEAVRHRPGMREVSFQLVPDESVLNEVIETIFQVHSYQEPVIFIETLLASRSKGRDDRANPHRWWNTTGDWKDRHVD